MIRKIILCAPCIVLFLNGALDSLDIAEGTSLDCNVNDVPDECDVEQGTSIDCDSNGLPDKCTVESCPPVDMVVLVDLSESMTNDGAISTLCNDIAGIRVAVDALNDSGFPYIDLDVFWIENNVIADYGGSTGRCPCCNSNGSVAQYGTTVPGVPEDLEECYSLEDWGPALLNNDSVICSRRPIFRGYLHVFS